MSEVTLVGGGLVVMGGWVVGGRFKLRIYPQSVVDVRTNVHFVQAGVGAAILLSSSS